MEQEHHQLIVHEEEEVEVEDCDLKRRQPLLHSKDNLVTGVVASSSSSSSLASNGSEHSNGVYSVSVVADPDGSSVQKEEEEVAEIGNVGENGKHFDNETVDGEAVGLGLVAEFVKTATNGEAITGATFSPSVLQNENSVYFDKQEGVWKCHHCTWTKRFDSPWTVPIRNLKGYPDLLMNVKTMIQHGPCFVWENKENEVNGLNGVQNGDATRSVYPTNPEESEFDAQAKNSDIQNNICSKVNNQCIETLDDKVPSSSELSSLHNSSDIQATAVVNSHEAANIKEGPLIKEIDHQLKEFDVEVVLEKQETHDLFCPNCNSCITKRVILKKRKRNIPNLNNKAKRDKLDIVVSSMPVDNSATVANQGDQANVTSDITNLEPPADNDHPEREAEVFGCLSCFSLFIPCGKGFNLFRNFGGASKQETPQNTSSINAHDLQNPSNIPGSNANWFFSIFTSNKGKTATEKGETSLEHSRTDPAEQHHSTSITSNMLTSPEIGHPEDPPADTALIEDVKPMADINNEHGGMNSMIENDIKSHMASGNEPLTDQKCLDSSFQYDFSSTQFSTKNAGVVMNGVDLSAKEQLLTGDQRTNEEEKKKASVNIIKTTDNVEVMSSTSFSNGMVSKSESIKLVTAATSQTLVNAGETAKDAILNPFEGEQFLVPTTPGSPILEKSRKDVDRTPEIVENSNSSSRQGTQPPAQSFGSTVVASEVASNKLSSGIDAIFPSKLDFPLKEKVQKVVEEEINPSVNKGGDVIVIVEREAFESKTSQTADIVPIEGAITTESPTQVGEQPRNEIGEPQQWEILKSIVYGGLVESITSLGIVSSAVSSGATPLNIIILGFANLIGGLFILGHNLNDLKMKSDHTGGDQQQTDVQDRYQELLGRRENFWLHAFVAVLSFIIFGSIPLIIYGLLISKNYYAEVKLAIVAATSVVCIILLAIGKVYTTRPPKSYIKTVLYYVTLALASSGISYIGGNLIKDLLEKFNHSESGLAIAMPISDTSMKSAWMSY